jgi:DUF971 family protein
MKPTEISIDKKLGLLIIQWIDNHHSEIPFGLVRAACPCAACRGGHENMRAMPDPKVFDQPLPEGAIAEIKDIEMVGSYAISFLWGDGHHFGIYHWDYLRALCPCSECRK